jgi:hypothetical protein
MELSCSMYERDEKRIWGFGEYNRRKEVIVRPSGRW